MKNKYKNLFEGKFTRTIRHGYSIPEQIYYWLSPSTYGDRTIFGLVKSYLKDAPKKLRILDIGCGGGHAGLKKFGSIYGIDISTASLRNAKHIYTEVKEADVTRRIPYPAQSFDVVFCMEVFGHIAKGDKIKFLKEAQRVIKPKGMLFFTIETYGNNIFTQYLTRKNLYKKIWVDYQGHIGLETPVQTVKRLKQYFTVLKVIPVSKEILPLDGYLILGKRIKFYTLLNQPTVRRLCNLFIAPFFYLSLLVNPFNKANDIVVAMKR